MTIAFCATDVDAEGFSPTAEKAEFFEQKIRPLLIERCYQCHSQAKQVKGKLRLDSRQGWETGGDSGAAIVPGKPDESLLISAVRYRNRDLQMPPDGKLSDAEIGLLEEWVRIGAPDPRAETAEGTPAGEKTNAAKKHWAFQPLRTTAVPAVHNPDWPLGEVDRFVQAIFEEKGLAPSPDADRYTWLRRVSLDLTGLPPTPAEIQAFVSDMSDHAWESVVDRLLASRDFGERWARPWLDLVGYADAIGSADNIPAENAWRYRDYVIRSFQADKPFDEFVREQLSGDLLTAGSIEQRQDQLTATGFLVLGNIDIVQSDKLVLRMDVVDQQIEKVGKAFMGMTLNCVRCHDHKFDPITLSDYYGLAGIFASTESTYKADRGVWSTVNRVTLPETLEQFTQREAAVSVYERDLLAVQKERTVVEARLQELERLAAAESAGSPVECAPTREEREKEKNDLAAQLKVLRKRFLHLNYVKPSPPWAFGAKDGAEIVNARVQVRGNPYVLGTELPRGFVQAATQGPVPAVDHDSSGRLQLAEWLTNAASPLVARVTVNRLWQRVFGRGIVGSVDYFGVRGERPTHPELLDYLAAEFIRDGWSQKRLIRRLVLSRTYRQRTEPDENSRPALAVDPDNRLYWRMSARRLDAEMVRDAVLAVSGGLEPSAGGPALALEFIENVDGLDPVDLDAVNLIRFSLSKYRENQPRLRTIYLPVVRSSEQRGLSEVLNFFDFAQPATIMGDRPTTAVASQALFLLNGPLLKESSRRLALDLLSQSVLTNNDERIAWLYLRVLNRPASSDEVTAVHEFLAHSEVSVVSADPASRDKSIPWQRLIHALLASNEFLFRL